jgi:long-chain acyl-CoA synthetase
LRRLLICSFLDMLPFPKNWFFTLFKGRDLAVIPRDEVHWRLDDIMDNDGYVTPVPIDPVNDVVLLQYTGGTTGTPKGAMLTHANIVANAHQCGLWFTDCRDGQEKMLGVIPFFHVFAMTAVMNLSVLKGLEIIALPRFDLADTMKLIDRKKPTLFPAVPAIFTAINNHPRLGSYNLRSLRHCISGGAPLPVEVKKSFEANTGCILVEGYGLTESSPVTHVNPLHGMNKPGSIGLPLPGTLVEIVDMNDRETVLPQGQKGEICLRGPQVMKGYWNKPTETADVLRSGRLHTGDVGYIDADGYTFIVDRIKDMIISNGYNVYPRNVEEAIYMHPDVAECIVAGLPDPERGERVKAWIYLKPGRIITGERMKDFLRDKLSPMEMPREFEFRDQPLPKTLIGKLSRKDVVAGK